MKKLLTLTILGCISTNIALGARRPNVLFILTDDQRYDAMSCMGHPHIDSL